jgi:UDP-GlcNAc:undecaprenyl-phosphate GlcNAc-1-phosphate transferase
MRDLALHCINSLLLSIVLISSMIKFAPVVGLVDLPSGRKQHSGTVPLVGSALFVAFAAALILADPRPGAMAGLLSGLTLLVITGILDDLYDLRASFKMVAQVVSVCLMTIPDQMVISRLGLFPGEPAITLGLAIPLTVFGLVGFINAMNMMDGVDGLAGTQSVVLLGWFAVMAALVDSPGDLSLSLLGSFCVLGFLGYNLRHPWRERAAAFLGDAGSMMLGAIIGYLAIALSQHAAARPVSPVTALWVCSLPTIDTLSLIARRTASGVSPFSADRRHLHHLLLDSGLSVRQVVATMAFASVVLGGIGVVGWYMGIPDPVMLIGLIVPVGLHSWFVIRRDKHSNWVSRADPLAGNGAVPLEHPSPGSSPARIG